MDVKLDSSTHDLALSGGDLVIITEELDTAQSIKIRLLTIAGEWFQDDTIGWIDEDRVFGKGVSLAYIRSKLLGVIEGTPGVLAGSCSFDRVALDRTTRTLSVEFRCKAVDGEVIDSEATITPTGGA